MKRDGPELKCENMRSVTKMMKIYESKLNSLQKNVERWQMDVRRREI